MRYHILSPQFPSAMYYEPTEPASRPADEEEAQQIFDAVESRGLIVEGAAWYDEKGNRLLYRALTLEASEKTGEHGREMQGWHLYVQPAGHGLLFTAERHQIYLTNDWEEIGNRIGSLPDCTRPEMPNGPALVALRRLYPQNERN